jgi:hypothetical protein
VKARGVVALLVAALAFYLVLIGVRGAELLGDHRWAVRGLGLGVLILPVVGIAIVARELRFGRASELLGRRLGAEDAEPPGDPAPPGDPQVPGAAGAPEPRRTASGRIDPEAADAVFAVRKAQVEAAPDDWRAWYRLGIAYGDARDTVRGRRAIRHAIALERAARAAGDQPSGDRAPA